MQKVYVCERCEDEFVEANDNDQDADFSMECNGKGPTKICSSWANERGMIRVCKLFLQRISVETVCISENQVERRDCSPPKDKDVEM